jgi:hypothetical protein
MVLLVGLLLYGRVEVNLEGGDTLMAKAAWSRYSFLGSVSKVHPVYPT